MNTGDITRILFQRGNEEKRFFVIHVTVFHIYNSLASLDADGSRDTKHSNHMEKTPWLVNNPASFHESKVVILDIREDISSMATFSSIMDKLLPTVNSYTDGEVMDALVEHFFWGMREM